MVTRPRPRQVFFLVSAAIHLFSAFLYLKVQIG
jgi:hypothetical protein